MEASFIIAFREGLEAFLVVGIILAFLEKSSLGYIKKYAWGGFVAGILSSFVLAFIFRVIVDGFESEDLQYNISLGVLALAIVLLTYMVFWMKNNSDTQAMHKKISLSNNQKIITFLIVFTAILREGLETVLFTLALMMDEEVSQNDVLAGLSLGLGVAGFFIYLLFKTSVKLPLKKFFTYSSYFIILIVAGLVSLFVKGLQAYEYIPTFVAPLYDSSFLLANDSMMGKVFGALVGYDAQPSLLQVVFWLVYVGSVAIIFQRKKNV